MGLELQLLFDDQLPPIRTAVVAARAATTTTTRTVVDDDGAFDDGYATPTSAASVLRAAPSVCPPAPRKPRPPRGAKRKHRHYCRRRCSGVVPPAQPRWIIAVPHDLAAVFVARRPGSPSTGSSLCRPPAGKKIRVHIVG